MHAKATKRWEFLFGLTSKTHTVILDFRRPDERARFISFVEALLPPSIQVTHARGPKAMYTRDSSQSNVLAGAPALF